MRLRKCGFLISFCVVIYICLFLNILNPTLLPEQLRFTATCLRPSLSNDIRDIHNPPKYRYPMPILRDYSFFNHHSWMPRFLDKDTHQKSIQLLRDIDTLFKQYEVTYTLIHGTLLGSFIFHDLIPWDDDLDILVSFRDVNKVRAIFRDPHHRKTFGAVSYDDPLNIYDEPYIGYDVNIQDYNSCGEHPDLKSELCMHKFHFYRKDSETTLRRQIGYPYIDVKYYTENSTHIWTIDDGENTVIHDRADIYPIHFRPLFNMWLPAPHFTRKILKHKFQDFKCASKWYSHHTQTIAMGYEVSCQFLTDCYPYVRRLPYCVVDCEAQDRGVTEQLTIGDQVIQEVLVDEQVHGLDPFQI